MTGDRPRTCCRCKNSKRFPTDFGSARVCAACIDRTPYVAPVKQTPQERKKNRRASNYKQHLRKAYGLTVEAYDALLIAQENRCAICGRGPDEAGWKKRLSVDHDHATGKVRGLLCNGCNVGLGSFRDTPALLLRAVDYLARHQ